MTAGSQADAAGVCRGFSIVRLGGMEVTNDTVDSALAEAKLWGTTYSISFRVPRMPSTAKALAFGPGLSASTFPKTYAANWTRSAAMRLAAAGAWIRADVADAKLLTYVVWRSVRREAKPWGH